MLSVSHPPYRDGQDHLLLEGVSRLWSVLLNVGVGEAMVGIAECGCG